MANVMLESRLERAFQEDVIFRYPEGTSLNQLKHVFLPERKNVRDATVRMEDFYQIKEDLDTLDAEVVAWHRRIYGKELNKFDTSAEGEKNKEQYRKDPRFKKALDLIGVDWEQHHSKIYLPWWNEVGASQISHEQLSD